jgi:hypothetical protein
MIGFIYLSAARFFFLLAPFLSAKILGKEKNTFPLHLPPTPLNLPVCFALNV